MKELLAAIKSQLQTDSTLNYVRDSDIIVTEDEDILPEAIQFPAIALKDGHITNTASTNNRYNQKMQVRIIAYVSIKKPEESIMGDKGILNFMKDIVTSLIDNRLGISSIFWAFPVAEEESMMFGDESEMIQKKCVIFEYERQQNI